jgi:hypothetical protein
LLALHVIGSLAYLIHDARKVSQRDRAMPALAQLATHVTNREPVAVLNLPENDMWIMMYLLDRDTSSLLGKNPEAIGKYDWLVQSKTAAAPVGFMPTASAGELALLRRETTMPATSTPSTRRF